MATTKTPAKKKAPAKKPAAKKKATPKAEVVEETPVDIPEEVPSEPEEAPAEEETEAPSEEETPAQEPEDEVPAGAPFPAAHYVNDLWVAAGMHYGLTSDVPVAVSVNPATGDVNSGLRTLERVEQGHISLRIRTINEPQYTLPEVNEIVFKQLKQAVPDAETTVG